MYVLLKRLVFSKGFFLKKSGFKQVNFEKYKYF